MTQRVKVAISGAAGQIGYAMLFRLSHQGKCSALRLR